MPRKKARPAVSFVIACVRVHVAEIGETSRALIIELSKCGYETIALGSSEAVGILSDADHQRDRAHKCGSGSRLDLDVAVADAWPAKYTGHEKRNRGSISRNRHSQRGRKRSRCTGAKDDCATACRRDTPYLNV